MKEPTRRTTDLRRLADFFGPAAVRLFALGVVVGTALFSVELGFAYALQIFLRAIGVLSASATSLPRAFSGAGLRAALAGVFALGAARGLLFWAFVYLQGAADERTRRWQRTRVLARAFGGQSANLGDITTHFNARAVAAGQVAAGLQSLAAQATVCVLLALNLLFLAPRATLALAAALAALAPPMLWADRRTKAAGERMDHEWAEVSRGLVVGVKNLLLLKIYGTEESERAKAQRSLDQYGAHVEIYHFLLGFKAILPQVFGLLLVCLVALAGPRSGLAPGALVTYFYLFLRLTQSLSIVNQHHSQVVAYWPQTRELMQWREREERAQATPASLPGGVLPAGPIGWRLTDMSFVYPGACVPALSRLSATVPAGTTAAIVGVSGAGKSTLLDLLLGVRAPTSGLIELVDPAGRAQPLAAARATLLERVGYVGPECYVIDGTVRENIAYGLPCPASDDDMRAALNRADCRFIEELPGGLDHCLTEQGQGLSAGQKQRLSLARALLREPKVLVLDEPTSNLDAESEKRLVEILRGLKGRMTILVATHSPALTALADRVVRLD